MIIVLRVLDSQGLSIYRPIIYGNTAVVLTPEERETHPSREHTHRWTVAVRSAASAEESDIVGGADDLAYFIRRVTFKLHETYPNPSRSKLRHLRSFDAAHFTTFADVDKPPFEVTETGYALSPFLLFLNQSFSTDGASLRFKLESTLYRRQGRNRFFYTTTSNYIHGQHLALT